MNLPDYHFLPAPLWLITILHVLTLTLHFIAMNFMVGGIIVLLFSKLKNNWDDEIVGRFVKLFPTIMAATVTLGVAPLLFVQLVYPSQVYSASIVSGWYWLMIIAVAIISYYFLYAAAFVKKGAGKPLAAYLAFALVGFLYISFVYSSVFSLSENPELYKLIYAENQSGLALNPDVGTYIFRWLHMLLGALTIGAFFIGLLSGDNQEVFNTGKRFFIYGMIGSIIVGLVYLLTLGDMLKPLMRSPAIWFIVAGFILSLAAIHLFTKKFFLVSSVLLFLSLILMVSTRHTLRLLRLEGVYDPSSYAINPQWSVFVIFLVCFIVALGAVYYMLRLFFAQTAQAN